MCKFADEKINIYRKTFIVAKQYYTRSINARIAHFLKLWKLNWLVESKLENNRIIISIKHRPVLNRRETIDIKSCIDIIFFL